MQITYELDLENFKAWSGAKTTLERIQNEGKCGQFERILEECYPEGITETQLNDLLWFDDEWCYETLGIRSYDKVKEELEEANEELEELQSNLQEELQDEDLTQEEKQSIIESYKDEINEAKEKIAELEEELENM